MWDGERTRRSDDLFGTSASGEEAPAGTPLRAMNPLERLRADYAGLRLTTGQHPMALIRERLPGICRAEDLWQLKDGQRVRVAGQVICRQRPGTAKGVCFVSLEDETGISNAIVAPALFEAERLTITAEPFLVIEGILQSRQGVIHIKARFIQRLDHEGLHLTDSHDFS
jgi:error-prone DNA polymerase